MMRFRRRMNCRWRGKWPQGQPAWYIAARSANQEIYERSEFYAARRQIPVDAVDANVPILARKKTLFSCCWRFFPCMTGRAGYNVGTR